MTQALVIEYERNDRDVSINNINSTKKDMYVLEAVMVLGTALGGIYKNLETDRQKEALKKTFEYVFTDTVENFGWAND